ncbi:MFS transporter [Saccharothrix sp. ALI-22-I]|uniref:MFS transporter n=1 Tax=Saccharothrix sp. ALI-22-I TaxID=1933778 RepID=UPI00097C9351|nr:MFS transporter [Saccharothrix sp. ALI-22-I]ONI92557.1 MFS transporter [Saccharothrix sp. ALI-22-I]
MPSALRATGPSTPPTPGAVVAVLALGGIVVALTQTIAIPLIPQLPRLLHASPSDATWVVTATLLAAAVATPTVGRLGDMYGKRRMLLASLVLLAAGSVVAALSDSLAPMVVGRVLQGLAAGVVPLGISIMRDVLPAERLGPAIAMMSASLGVGGALGLPAATVLADRADWRLVFWISGGLAVLTVVLVVSLVPASGTSGGGFFDVVGAIGLSTALVCLLLAVSEGAEWGWTSGLTTGLSGVAVVILVAWGWWELRVARPLVDLRVAARRQVLLTNLASAVLGFSMFAISLALPQLLQLPTSTGYGLGQSMTVVGLVLAPAGLLMMAVAPLSARVSAAKGPATTLVLGSVVVAAGYLLGTVLMSAVWHLLLASSVIGAGVGLAYGAMPSLVMAAVPLSETAAGNSLNSLVRAIGTSLSSAVTGVVLSRMSTVSGSVELLSQAGFRAVMVMGACAALAAAGIALFLRTSAPVRTGSTSR